MKKRFLFYSLLILFQFFFFAKSFGQAVGDYGSIASGDASTPATWGVWDGSSFVNDGTLPGGTKNVFINAGHTVYIDVDAAAANLTVRNTGILEYRNSWSMDLTINGNLLIETGGELRSARDVSSDRTHSLYVNGDMTVNGTFDGYYLSGNETAIELQFEGASSNTFSGTGTAEVYEMTINKGTSMANVLELTMASVTLMDATASHAQSLFVSNGTFKISTGLVSNPFIADWENIVETSNACLWINHAGASIGWADASGNATCYGDLRMDGGSFSAPGQLTIQGSSSGNNYFKNATVNNGGFDLEQDLLIENSTVNVGGDFYVDANGADEYGDLIITNSTLVTTARFAATGPGTIQINGATTDIDVGGDSYVEGEFVMNDGSFDVTQDFRIEGTATANNQINGGSINIGTFADIEQALAITGGTINIGTNLTIDANGADEYGEITYSNAAMTVGAELMMTEGANFTVNSGTVTSGDGNDAFDIQDASFTMNGGTVTHYGYISTNNGAAPTNSSFTMSAGTFTIDPQHTTNLANSLDIVLFNDNSVVDFTGGTMIIADPHASKDIVSRDAIDIRGTTGAKNFVGSTIQFGDGVSSSAGDATNPGYSIYIGGTVQLGDIVLNNPAGSNRQFVNRDNTDIYCNNLTITTANDEYRTTGRLLDIAGDFENNGIFNGNSAGSHLYFTGSAAQEYSGTGSFSDYLPDLTFNNTSATGVTVSAPMGASRVHMTDGHVYTDATGLLTVFGTATTDLDGYSPANYVVGPIRRAIPAGLSGTEYEFPVGRSTYDLLEMFGLTSSGSGFGFITAQSVEAATTGTGGDGLRDPLNAENIYWKIEHDLGTVSLDAVANVRLAHTPTEPPAKTIGQSNNTHIGGTYTSIGGTVAGGTIASDSYDLSGINPSGTAYLVIGEVDPLTGTYYVGDPATSPDAGRTFWNLTEVSDILRKKVVDDNVIFEMLDSYDDATETIPVIFDMLVTTDAAYDVTIRPRSGVAGTVTERAGTSDNEAIIIIDGIEDLTFDGRPGGAGASDWIFSNTRGTNPGAAFEFRNDASNNALTYLTIKSDTQNEQQGVVKFGAGSSTGNDDNTISYCDITGYTANPINGVYSEGSAGAENDNNTVSNNNIFDFFASDKNTHGVYLAADNSDWTISSNRFYQSAQRTFNTATDELYAGIRIASGDNHTIDGNIIGYADNAGTGYTDITNAASSTGRFFGILYQGNGGTASDITNNEISGIRFLTYSTDNSEGVFGGITLTSGNANIGTAGNGNTIGTSGAFINYPIQITVQNDDGQIIPILANSGSATTIRDNNIGGIETFGDSFFYFMGIQTAQTENYTILGNTIGSTSEPESIKLGQSGYTNAQYCYGIWVYNSDALTLSGNTVQNIIQYHDGSTTWRDAFMRGIQVRSNSNGFTLSNNTIADLSSYTVDNDAGEDASIIGIADESTASDQIISGNSVHSLEVLNASSILTRLIGIYSDGVATVDEKDQISENFVHSISCQSNQGGYAGIYLSDGNYNIHNNMIRLGIDKNGNDIDNTHSIFGINFYGVGTTTFLHNSVYIGGGVSASSDINTYAYYKNETENSTVRNNIFVNARSNNGGGTGENVAYFLSFDENVDSDYNIYNAPGTGGIIAQLDGFDFSALRGIQDYTNYGDLHSGEGDPVFANPTGDAATVSLHLSGTTAAEGMGDPSNTLATDIDGQTRATLTPVDIGADAGNYNFTAAVDIYPPTFIYDNIDPQNCGVSSFSFQAQIIDQGVGVNNTAGTRPYIYYKDVSGVWGTDELTDEGTLVSGTVNDGTWEFTLSGLSDGVKYEYYLVAQDQATTPNLGYSKFDDNSPVHTSVTAVTTYPDSDVDIDIFTVCIHPAATYYVGNDAGCTAELGHVCDFETLTAYQDFFFNMNSMVIDKDVTCYVVADTQEPATYGAEEIVEDPVGSNFTITIRPYNASVKNLVTNNTVNKKQIRLEGADRYTFDGQYDDGSGGDGNRWLNFVHEKNDQSVFYFVDDAQNNTLQYLSIKGQPELIASGIIQFDTTKVATGSGNDNNSILNNEITANTDTTYNAVLSSSTVADPADTSLPAPDALANSGNTISGNLISDFNQNGIWLTEIGNGDGWTISDNTMFNPLESPHDQYALNLESGYGHTISGNHIGGTAADNSGTWTNDGGGIVNMINLKLGTTAVTTVSNNHIQNLHTLGEAQTRGIRVHTGQVDITGNTISNFEQDGEQNLHGISYSGSAGTNISNNTITGFTKNAAYDMYGIYLDTDAAGINTVSGNVINALTINSLSTFADIYAIFNQEGPTNITGNNIGGPNPAEQITNSGGDVEGIRLSDTDGTNPLSVADNTISGITLSGNDPASDFKGIYILNGDAALTNNTIGGTNAGDKITVTGGSFNGIHLNSGSIRQDFSGNSVSNAEAASNAVHNGIYIYNVGEDPLNVYNNTVDNITVSNTGAAVLNAFYLHDSDLNFYDNIIGTASGGMSNAGTGLTTGIYFDDDFLERIAIYNNTITNISGAGKTVAIFDDSSVPASVHNNTVSGISIGNDIPFIGIEIAGGTADVQGNQINDITLSNTGASTRFSGIWLSGGSSTVGTTTANFVGAVSDPIASSGTGNTDGISISNGTHTIQKNQISAISGGGGTNGIAQTGGTATLNANTVTDINIAADITFSGINQTGGTMTANSNTVSNVSLTNTGANTFMNGIWTTGGTCNSIDANTLTNLSSAGTGDNNIINFENTTAGTFSVSNNIINGINVSGNTSTRAVNIDAGNTTTVNVADNKIHDFKQTGAGADAHLTGINVFDSGKLNALRNEIGNPAVADDFMNSSDGHTNGIFVYTGADASSVTDNTLSNLTQAGDGYIAAINIAFVGTGAASLVDNNLVQTIKNTSVSTNASLKGIKAGEANSDYYQITNNTITGLTGDGLKETIGIDLNSNGNCSLTGNTISNLSQTDWHTGAVLIGMEIRGNGNHNVSQNVISDLSAANINTNTSGKIAAQGILADGNGSYIISENSISALTLQRNAVNHIAGISEAAPNAIFTKNKIWNITNTSAPADRTVNGFILSELNAGYIANNMISLGANDDTNYRGIYISRDDATADKKVYFNSVYIGGTATGGSSYALLKANVDAPATINNNIFSNFRGGAGNHYAIAVLNTTGISSVKVNANAYYSANTTGNWGGTDVDFATWISNTGEDADYLSTDQMPTFIDPANCDLHIDPADACGFNSVGITGTGIADDFDGDARNSNPDIGADEFTPTGRSGEYVWRGWTSDDWDTGTNWQCEQVPANTPGERIVITHSGQEAYIKRALPAATYTGDNMWIMNNAILHINPGNSLTLNGDLTMDGNLVIESPTSEGGATGSFIDNGTITGSGTMIAKRFINANQWHEVSSPVQNETSAIFTRTNATGNFNPNFYRYNETVDLDGNPATNPTGTDPFESDSLVGGWEYAHNMDGGADITLTENEGYLFYTDGNQMITYTGEPNTGNFDATGLSFNGNDPRTDSDGDDIPELYDGWHLLGNPYPSSLDWDLVRDDQINNVDDGVYVWDATGYSGYKNGSSVMLGNLGNEIPPMQGFFVRTHTDGGSVEIRNEHRTHGAPEYLKSPDDLPNNYLKIKTSANGWEDYFVTHFASDATTEYDEKYDLLRMFSADASIPQLYSRTLEVGDPLVLNALPKSLMFGYPDTLGLRLGTNGTYRFELEEFRGFDNTHVVLEDRYEEVFTNFRSHQQYEFAHEAGTVEDRFVVHYGENNPPQKNAELQDRHLFKEQNFEFELPENMFSDEDLYDELRISAELSDGNELPDWLHFNGRAFSGKAQVADTFEIAVIASDLLGQTAADTFKIFVKSPVNIEDTPQDVQKESVYSVYPNPTSDYVNIELPKNHKIEFIRITDISGRAIHEIVPKAQITRVDVSELPAGIYQIEILASNRNYIEKLIKQ